MLTTRNIPTPKDVARSLAPYGIHPSPELTAQIFEYVRLLVLWNQKVNLTRVADSHEILTRHFGESLLAVNSVPIKGGRLADVGSGAGFPGLALKLAVPELELILIESNTKKAAFLNEVVRRLHLKGVVVLRKRMEEVQPGEIQPAYVTARAVGNLPELVAWAWAVLQSQGRLVLWLGGPDCVAVANVQGWVWRKPALIPGTANAFILVGTKVP